MLQAEESLVSASAQSAVEVVGAAPAPHGPTRAFPWRPGAFAMLTLGAVAGVVLLFTAVGPRVPGFGILVGGVDLSVYRDGAFRVLEGLPLYTEPVVFGLMYTYTPFSTIVFIPLQLFPAEHILGVWFIANLCALLGVILLSWRMLRYRLTPSLVLASVLIAATAVFLEPVRTTLYYGQVNLFLMLVVLWDFSRREKGLLRGVGIGVVTGIKLTPGYFIVVLLALRQWRSAAVALGAVLGSIVLAWAVLPTDSREYWTNTFFEAGRIGEDRHPSNQSIRGLLGHLLWDQAPTWLWLLLVAAVLAVSLVVTVGLYRRDESLLAVVLSGLTASAISPFSWGHHWVWFVPLLVYLVHLALGRAWWWLAAVALFAATGAWTWTYATGNVAIGLFLFPIWWSWIQVLLNIYLIVFAAVLIGATVRVWGPIPQAASAQSASAQSASVQAASVQVSAAGSSSGRAAS